MSPVAALGYVVLEVSDVARWGAFATDVLGLMAGTRADGSLDLRLDAYAWRIRLVPGARDDIVAAGWEVRDAAALAALADRMATANVVVETGDDALAADRCVAGLIRFADPEGLALEAFWGPLQATHRPFISPLGVRFKTGPQGLGHIVLATRDKPAAMAFWTEAAGLRLSDHILTEVRPGHPLELSFLRCNGRHHSLALAPVPVPRRLVHLMVEVTSIDDVGRAMERCEAARVHLSLTLGRHSNDEMLSFYALTPSGFDVEYGWGGLEVDDERWHVLTHDRMSAWGHRFQRPPRPAA